MSLNNSLRACQGGYQLSPPGNKLSYKVAVEKKKIKTFSVEVAAFEDAKIQGSGGADKTAGRRN